MTRSSIRRTPAFLVATLVAGMAGMGCGGDKSSPDAVAAEASLPTPEAIEAVLAAADDYFNTQEIEKAEIILARLLERAPRIGRVHELMGQVLTLRAGTVAASGDTESARKLRREAYDHYRTATEIGPPSAGLEQSAGTIAMVAGEPEAALAHFEAASALDPVNPQHPLYAAQLFIANDAHDAARIRLERVLELDAEEPLAHASLAIIALAEGRTDDALSGIALARSIAPLDTRFRVQEARILRRSGRARQAVETLLALGESEWRQDAVAIELAEGFAAIDRHRDAARVWTFRFGAGEPTAASYLDAARAGEALRRAGDIDSARHWLHQATVLAPSAPEVRALATALDTPE